MNVLARACAVRLDGFVGYREELAVPERQRRVRVGVTTRSLGPRERADEIERAFVPDRIDHYARVEVAAVCAIALHDDVMRADVALVRRALGVSLLLSWPPPARGKPRIRRIPQVDDDQDPVPVTALARRGVGVSPAGEPNPVHTQPVDREEADAPWVGGLRHVVHHEAGALRDAEAIRVLLVVGEEETLGELHLV